LRDSTVNYNYNHNYNYNINLYSAALQCCPWALNNVTYMAYRGTSLIL